MTFDELVQKLQSIPVDEERSRSEGYLEFVLSSRHLIHLYPVLEKYFGPPFKPPGISPTKEAQAHTRSYGGILKHQTLYFFKRDGLANCAMIWPWGDNSRVTVKVAQGIVSGPA